MASARGIRAGRAFVELGIDDQFSAPLRAAQRRLQAFGAGVSRIGRGIALTAFGAAAPIATVSVLAASKAEETLNKFNQVFRSQARDALGFANDLAGAVGRSETQVIDALSTYQALFVGFGFGEKQARDLSEALTALTIDFGSFFNRSDDESLKRFISALSGSPEVLDAFGINMKQAALESELLALGIDKPFIAVTEQEKVLARVSLLYRTLGKDGLNAIGDAVRTAGSFENQLKRLRGAIFDASVAIGKALIPVVLPFVKAISSGAVALAAFAEENGQTVRFVFALAGGVAALGVALVVVGGTFILLGAVLGGIANALGAIAFVVVTLKAGLLALASPLGLAAIGFGTLFGVLLSGSPVIARAAEIVGVAASGIGASFKSGVAAAADAIKAGDLQLAAQIASTTVKVIFAEAGLAVFEIWQEAVTDISKLFTNLGSTIRTTAVQALSSFAAILVRVGFQVREIYATLLDAFAIFEKVSARTTLIDSLLSGSGVNRAFVDVGIDQALRTSGATNDRNAINQDLPGSKLIADDEARQAAILAAIQAAASGVAASEEAQRQAGNDAADAIKDAAIEDRRRSLEALRGELQDLLERDPSSADPAGANGGPDPFAGLSDELDKLLAGFRDGTSQELADRNRISGQFSSFGLGGLGGFLGPVRQAAEGAKETADNTREILTAIENQSGLAFTGA